MFILSSVTFLLAKSMQAPTVVRNGVPRINETLFPVAIFKTVRSIGMVQAPIFNGKSLMRPIGVVEEESPNISKDVFGSMFSIPRLFTISIEITFTLAPESTRASSSVNLPREQDNVNFPWVSSLGRDFGVTGGSSYIVEMSRSSATSSL